MNINTENKNFELWKALSMPVQEYDEIVKKLEREPNELEIYLFSAMWSEHCGYKHSRKYLSRFPKKGSLHSEENAGGIEIGDHAIFFKVESHNHPSAVEPFQGAATGIGGIIRDVLSLGARPIALLDSLKFGNLKDARTKHLFEGVVDGISHYGNSIGVPTVGGEVSFDSNYTDSPLVNVMAVGIVNKNDIKVSSAQTGNKVLLVGSHTGRDGIHGASFASKELSEKSKEDRPSVQIGDPFIKKILIESTLEILKLDEVVACQDCGAAGLLSSTSEMTYKGNCGMNLHLETVHLREEGMQPWEILLSESQERMIFIVTPEGVEKVLNICKKYDMPVSVIGDTDDSQLYSLFWHGEKQSSIDPEILNKGPEYTLNEDVEPEYIKEYKEKSLTDKLPFEDVAKKVIGDPNFASKKWVYSQYDHMVGNRTALKPGISGAAGIWLQEEGGVLGLTIDSCVRQVFLDPYNGSKNTVWECYRNLVSSGFEPMGVTDCLNYGNPEKDEVAYQFVKSVDGISDACKEADIPVVSGNVSFYNESPDYRVFPTPTIGMIGYTDSTEKLISNEFKENETVFLIGKNIKEESKIGGSLYQRVAYDFIGGEVNIVHSKLELKLKNIIFKLRDENLISGCNDVSEGGLFGALFESLKNGSIGFNGQLPPLKDIEKSFFGEVTGRYIFSTNKPEKVIELLEQREIFYKKLGICEGNSIKINDFCFNTKEFFDIYNNSIEEEIKR